MQNCAILGCQNSNVYNLIYFKFPLDNKKLLAKWLKEIGRKDWYPNDNDLICSKHFQSSDILSESKVCPLLKANALPRKIDLENSKVPNQSTCANSNKAETITLYFQKSKNRMIDRLEHISAKVPAAMNTLPLTSVNKNQSKPSFNVTGNCHRIVSKSIDLDNNTMKKVSNLPSCRKVPVLRITVNKKYNVPRTSSLEQDCTTINKTENLKVCNFKVDSEGANQEQNCIALSKCITSGRLIKPKCATMLKTTSNREGDFSGNNSLYQSSRERLRYLYAKSRRDVNILKIRLKALQERYNQEAEEIKKIQRRSRKSFDDDIKKCKKASIIIDETKEEIEYERLNREIRNIKQHILNQDRRIIELKKKVEKEGMDSNALAMP